MRAFHGAPELMDLPEPRPRPDEVLVRMAAAGVNPFDWKILDGILDGQRPHTFPLIAGIDGAGWVEEVGSSVRRFGVGDPIFGQFLHDPVGTGTFAEFATVPDSVGVVKFPSELGPVAAAGLPTAGMTALDALDRLALEPGSSLLIVGASGGVGSLAVELAAARGARVTAVAGSRSTSRLESLGAAQVVPYAADTAVEQVRVEHPAEFDALLDLVSDSPRFFRWTELVRAGGRAATTVYAVGPETRSPRGVTMFDVVLHSNAALLDRLTSEFVRRGLKVPVERTIRLPEVPAALIESRAGRSTGKTVVVISDRSR